MREVVVTGLGLVTPLGLGTEINWKRLISGKVGIKKINNFDVSDLPCKIAGQIPSIEDDNEAGLNFDDWIHPKELRKIDRFIAYGLIASEIAVKDSGWKADTELQKLRTGVLVGSGIGGLETIANTAETLLTKGVRRVSPFFIPASLINLISGHK